MRKIISGIMAAVMFASLILCTGCDIGTKLFKSRSVKVYECSSDNMFGLEKISVYKDKVVVEFDKEKCDESYNGAEGSYFGSIENDVIGLNDQLVSCVILGDGVCYSECILETTDTQYIATVPYDREKETIYDASQGSFVTGVGVKDRRIFFQNGDIEISIEVIAPVRLGKYFEQTYDSKSGEWSEMIYDYYPLPGFFDVEPGE